MVEKLRFVWHWIMAFLFGKKAGNSTHESTTWVIEDSNGDVVWSTLKEPSSVVVNEVAEKAKEAVDALPVKKEEDVKEIVKTPEVVKETKSNKTRKKLLKDEDVRYIRKNAKVSKKELAVKFGVSEDTIRRIIKGETYKNVK